MAKKDIKRNPAAEKIADLILSNYDVQNAKDVNEALKDVFGPIFEKMLNAEMDAHLGYDKSSSEQPQSLFQGIEKAHLSQLWYQNIRRMFLRLKERF